MKRDTKFRPGVSGNPNSKWQPGQSGNPAGKSKRRSQFEEAFNEALIAGGGPEEAAALLWKAARAKEPWAIQELCRRFAPPTQSVRLFHEVEDDNIDYSKLSNEELDQLDGILKRARLQPLSGPKGKGTATSL